MDKLFIKSKAICDVYDSRKYTINQLSKKLELRENEIRTVLHEYNYFNGKKLTTENTDKPLKIFVNGNKLNFLEALSLNDINNLL